MLDQAPRRPIALFLGVLVLLSTAAALVLPDGARGENFQTVGTLGTDAEAHAVTLHDGERARFQLQPEAGEATPTLRFALYDPLDRHFSSFELEGMGDHVEVLVDQPGDWVVVVVSQRNANLAVQLPEDQASDDRVNRLEMRESTRDLVTQEGDAVDERVAFRMSERPAVAFLRASGTMQELDATLASEDGPVYQIRGMSVNATVQERGERVVNLANLRAGTYTLTAQATELNGSVSLVLQHYVRTVEHVQVDHDPNDTVNESHPEPPEENSTREEESQGNASEDASLPGLLVARLAEHEPALVTPDGATNLTLAVAEDTWAHVYVYNASDDLVQNLVLEAEHRRHDANDQGTHVTVPVPAGEDLVVYVAKLRGHGDEVQVRLHDAGDAANATLLETERTSLELEGNHSANTTLAGGLLHVDVHVDAPLEFHREVNVTGPHGVVMEYEQAVSALGMAWRDADTTPAHFADGAYTAYTDGGSGWRGEVIVDLVSYVR